MLVLRQRVIHIRNFDLSGAYVLVVDRLVAFVVPLLAEGTLKIAGNYEPGFRVCVAIDPPFVGCDDYWIRRSGGPGRTRCRRRGLSGWRSRTRGAAGLNCDCREHRGTEVDFVCHGLVNRSR